MYRVILASTEEDHWKWDDDFLYDGKTYRIDDGSDRVRHTNDPKQAILYWFKGQVKHPSDGAIFCRKRTEAIALCEAALDGGFLEACYEKYKCPYKLEYMLDCLERSLNKGCNGLIEGSTGDQVDPFSYG